MKLTRQQILLGILVLAGVFKVGDYVINSMIQGPLDQLRTEQQSLKKEIQEREKLLAEARTAGKKIEVWQNRSLPTQVETARSLYRNWLLNAVRKTRMQNATVDSGSVGNRYGLYRVMPFTVKARGSLSQLTIALYQFESSPLMHEIKSMRLSPLGSSGYFDISLSIEAVIVPGSKRKTLPTGKSNRLASSSSRDYLIIARDNIFGIGIDDHNPMKMTVLSAVTSRNGEPQAWITELKTGRVIKVGLNEQLNTLALSGRVVQIGEENAVIETAGQLLELSIGQSFSQGKTSELKETVIEN